MSGPECRNELAIQARRQRLSAADQARLEKHLAGCASCRFDAEVGAAFDRVGALPVGYEVRHAGLADGVLRRFRPASTPRVRRVGWMTPAVAAVIVATAAAASAILTHRAAIRPSPVVAAEAEPPRALEAEPARATGAAYVDLGPPFVPAPAASPSVAALAVLHHAVRRVHAPDAPSAPSAPTPQHADGATAASLFERATLERRHKRDAAAIELYAELQRRFPGSDEARVSHVSLGRLLLDHGMSAEAIAQFDDYLASAGDGSLGPEALVGEAHALEASRRGDEARAAWRRLLAVYPASVYAPEAKQRLQASP
jgi:TolA-binding protein